MKASVSLFHILCVLLLVLLASPSTWSVKDDDETPFHNHSFNFASHTAGAVIIDKSPATARGFHNLLNDDKDKYGICPCQEKKWVVIGLAEDVLITSVAIANYEKYSSMLKEFQLLASTAYPTNDWIDLGTYTAEARLGEQSFNISSPDLHTRFLKVKFITHYLDEALCTLSQIKVHGVTVIASLKQEVEMSRDHLQMLRNEEEREGASTAVGLDDALNASAASSTDGIAPEGVAQEAAPLAEPEADHEHTAQINMIMDGLSQLNGTEASLLHAAQHSEPEAEPFTLRAALLKVRALLFKGSDQQEKQLSTAQLVLFGEFLNPNKSEAVCDTELAAVLGSVDVQEPPSPAAATAAATSVEPVIPAGDGHMEPASEVTEGGTAVEVIEVAAVPVSMDAAVDDHQTVPGPAQATAAAIAEDANKVTEPAVAVEPIASIDEVKQPLAPVAEAAFTALTTEQAIPAVSILSEVDAPALTAAAVPSNETSDTLDAIAVAVEALAAEGSLPAPSPITVTPVHTSLTLQACMEMQRFADFQAKMLLKLQSRDRDETHPIAMKDNNIFRQLMQRIKNLEMNYVIAETYINQLGDCNRLLSKEIKAINSIHANATCTAEEAPHAHSVHVSAHDDDCALCSLLLVTVKSLLTIYRSLLGAVPGRWTEQLMEGLARLYVVYKAEIISLALLAAGGYAALLTVLVMRAVRRK